MASLPTISNGLRLRALIGLALVTVAAYSPALWSGYVYDDTGWITVQQLGASWLVPSTGFSWQAFTKWPWALAWLTGGGLPWAFHSLVVMLHLLNGFLLWHYAHRWMSDVSALLVVALFWLHPIQTEAVAYVSGGMEVLIASYVLLALLCGPTWIGSLCLAAAVLTKPSAAPVLLVVPALWGLPALQLGGIAMLAGLLAWLNPTTHAWLARTGSLTMRARAVYQLSGAIVTYLREVVLLNGFSIEHDAWISRASALGLFAAGALAWGWRAPRAAWLWMMALLLPRALVLHEASPLTEHHTYLPFLAVWGLAGTGLDCYLLKDVPCA